jgi:hypothetical protein
MEGRAVGHNSERDPPRDHPCQVWFNPNMLEPTIYRTRGEHANHYTTDAVQQMIQDGLIMQD